MWERELKQFNIGYNLRQTKKKKLEKNRVKKTDYTITIKIMTIITNEWNEYDEDKK